MEAVRRDQKGTIIFSFTSTLPWVLWLSSLYLLLYSLVVAIVKFLLAHSFLAFVDIGSLQRVEGLYPLSYNLTTKCVKMKAQAVDQILPNVHWLERRNTHIHTSGPLPCSYGSKKATLSLGPLSYSSNMVEPVPSARPPTPHRLHLHHSFHQWKVIL